MNDNYIDDIAIPIGILCDMDLKDPNYARLLRSYALLAIVKGIFTSSKDVHDAWSAWRVDTDPDHRSLVPFNKLTKEVQDLDNKYRDAIRDASHVLGLPRV